MNRFVWDLRWSEPTQIPGAFYEGLPPWGPIALPGSYTVKLTVDGKPQTAPLVIFNDPRSKASDADLRASFELQLKMRALIDALHTAVDPDPLDARADGGAAGAARRRRAGKELVAAIDAIDARMDAIEGQLVQVKLGSSEGMLRFPSMLNEQLDSFRGSIEARSRADPAAARALRGARQAGRRAARGVEGAGRRATSRRSTSRSWRRACR